MASGRGIGPSSEKSTARVARSKRRGASTTASASARPAYVGNLAFPEDVEFSRSVTANCHFPDEERRGLVPETREELSACLKVALGGSVLMFALMWLTCAAQAAL